MSSIYNYFWGKNNNLTSELELLLFNFLNHHRKYYLLQGHISNRYVINDLVLITNSFKLAFLLKLLNCFEL